MLVNGILRSMLLATMLFALNNINNLAVTIENNFLSILSLYTRVRIFLVFLQDSRSPILDTKYTYIIETSQRRGNDACQIHKHACPLYLYLSLPLSFECPASKHIKISWDCGGVGERSSG